MSNLPPGVSGNEWAIRGPKERTEDHYCEECEDDFTVTVAYSGPPNSSGPPTAGHWVCPKCGTEYEVSPD